MNGKAGEEYLVFGVGKGLFVSGKLNQNGVLLFEKMFSW